MNDDRMDEYYQYAATAKTIGVDVRFLTPDEIQALADAYRRWSLAASCIPKMATFSRPT